VTSRVAREFAGALDLWSVKVLSGFGLRLRVVVFRRMIAAAFIVSVPVVLLVSTVGVSLVATLVTDTPTGSEQNALFAAGLGVAMVVFIGYASVLDLLRQHCGVARYAVSRSPVRGLWLAADIGLAPVVLVERGAALAWRAMVQAAALLGVALYVRRTLPTLGGDLMAIAILLPLALLAVGLTVATWHAARDRGQASTVRLLAAAVPLTGMAAVAAARWWDGATPSGHLDDPIQRVSSLGEALPHLRLGALVVLVLGIAVLTVTAAAAPGHEVAPDRPDHGSRPSSASVTAAMFAGAGGLRRAQVAVRVVGMTVLAAAAGLGWRLGGGSALAEPMWPAVERGMVMAAAAGGMAVSGTFLLLLGQTRRLWHDRALWELGVGMPALLLGWLRPTALAAGVMAAALGAFTWGLGDLLWAPSVMVLAAAASEHAVDSMFARGDTSEGARTSNSLLAVTGFLALVPPLLAGMALAPWSIPALVLWMLTTLGGGMLWFSRRVRTLPITAV
jgi:hypothetical protein